MTGLRPVHNAILFQFLNATTEGQFLDKNRGRILISRPELDTQGKYGRWVRVEAVGDAVTKCQKGDIVLLHPGKWTTGFTFEESKFWKSDDEWVLAIGEESMAYDFITEDS